MTSNGNTISSLNSGTSWISVKRGSEKNMSRNKGSDVQNESRLHEKSSHSEKNTTPNKTLETNHKMNTPPNSNPNSLASFNSTLGSSSLFLANLIPTPKSKTPDTSSTKKQTPKKKAATEPKSSILPSNVQTRDLQPWLTPLKDSQPRAPPVFIIKESALVF